jgi:hypothetical protein
MAMPWTISSSSCGNAAAILFPAWLLPTEETETAQQSGHSRAGGEVHCRERGYRRATVGVGGLGGGGGGGGGGPPATGPPGNPPPPPPGPPRTGGAGNGCRCGTNTRRRSWILEGFVLVLIYVGFKNTVLGKG